MTCNLYKDIMSVSATHFKGKLLICGTCVKDINPEKFKELSKDRKVYTFCPEMTHSSLLGYKLTTILRACDIKDIWIFTKDGSPHCAQILTTLQEVAENVNFNKSKLRYFVTKKGRFLEITDRTIKKSRNIMKLEKLMSFNKLYKVTEILMGENGCPNDKRETFESTLNHLEEEIQELKEGLRKKDWNNIEEELGDILFNIFLFSKVAQNNDKFDIFDLFEKTSNKLIKNHKKIFKNKNIK